MDDPHATPETPGAGYWSWFGFWAQFVVLGLLAILGAFSASEGGQSGDYTCGMLLSLGAIALAFLRLKDWFDGGAVGWTGFLFVDDMPNLAIVVPVFAMVGLVGLFVAAGAEGSLQNAGIGLFVVSGLVVFLSLKRVFDNLDSHR